MKRPIALEIAKEDSAGTWFLQLRPLLMVDDNDNPWPLHITFRDAPRVRILSPFLNDDRLLIELTQNMRTEKGWRLAKVITVEEGDDHHSPVREEPSPSDPTKGATDAILARDKLRSDAKSAFPTSSTLSVGMDIITDATINDAFGELSVPGTTNREILDSACLRVALGYSNVGTVMEKLHELGVVTRYKGSHKGEDVSIWALTELGKRYTWEVYHRGRSR